MVFTAISEIAVLSILTPVMNAYFSDEKFVSWITLDVSRTTGLLIAMFLILVANTLRVINVFNIIRYAYNITNNLSDYIFTNVSNAKLSWIVSKVPEDVTSIYLKINTITTSVLIPSLNAINSSILASLIFMYLIYFYFLQTIIFLVFLGTIVYLLSRFVRMRLVANSGVINKALNQVAQMNINFISDHKFILQNTQLSEVEQKFKGNYKRLVSKQAENAIYSGAPRYIIEGIALILVLFTLVLVEYVVGRQEALETIVVFGYAGLKTLPAVQNGYNAWSSIKGNTQLLSEVIDYSKIPSRSVLRTLRDFDTRVNNFSVKLKVCINQKWKDFHFNIKGGEQLQLTGPSGCGKSTFLNSIAGFATDPCNDVLLNGVNYSYGEYAEKIWAMSRFVDQRSFYPTGDIKAFCDPKNELSTQDFQEILKIVCLDGAFSNSEIPVQFDGRSSNVSGGQLERLFIARALVTRPKILFLDEATSGVDRFTEARLFENIRNWCPEITIVLISHSPHVEGFRKVNFFELEQ